MKSVCLLLLAMVAIADSYRFLAVVPTPMKSHHNVFRPILEALAKKGHEIVLITGSPYKKVPANIKEIIVARSMAEIFHSGGVKFDQVSFGEMSIPEGMRFFYMFGYLIGNATLSNPEVQELIKSETERFDAILLETYFAQEYFSAFIHKFGAVGIEIVPLGDVSWMSELAALPDNPSWQIDIRYEYSPDMDFFGRLYNTYLLTTVTLMSYFYLGLYSEAFAKKHFNYKGSENRPPIWKLESNRSLILTNSHFATGYPAPLPPHRKEIGGINVVPNKPLPKDLQDFMDNAPNGVILMSLGSNVNVSDVAGESLREEFMTVFSKLPQRVIMKWETEYNGKLPSNVKTSSWLPQQDILAHKNLRLFITHGGLLSLNEAMHHGVPLVGIPFFGDQVKNLIKVEESGYGRMLRFRNLSRTSIGWAVNEVLSNERYKKEALRRSQHFRDRRQSPVEEAVYWIEFAVRNPNVLTPKGAFLNFWQLHQLDVMAFIGAVVLLISYLSMKIFCWICCSRREKPKKRDKVKKN